MSYENIYYIEMSYKMETFHFQVHRLTGLWECLRWSFA